MNPAPRSVTTAGRGRRVTERRAEHYLFGAAPPSDRFTFARRTAHSAVVTTVSPLVSRGYS